jgi:hypothetical protein
MLLRNIMLENNSPFEEHNNVSHSYMFRWIVKFSIGVNKLEEHRL